MTLGGVIVMSMGGRLIGHPLFTTSEVAKWIVGGSAVLGLGVYAGWIGRKMCQLTAVERMRNDRRSPVLLLRSFRMDEMEIHRPFEWSQAFVFHPDYFRSRARYTFEESLVAVLERIGPVVAIGRPGETAAPLGAARTYVSDDVWQQEVMRLAGMSSLVVMIVDNTNGLRWEIGAMSARAGGLDHLLLVVPPTTENAEELIAPLRTEFPFLPTVPQNTVGVRFRRDGTPRVYVAPSPNSRGAALQQVALDLVADHRAALRPG